MTNHQGIDKENVENADIQAPASSNKKNCLAKNSCAASTNETEEPNDKNITTERKENSSSSSSSGLSSSPNSATFSPIKELEPRASGWIIRARVVEIQGRKKFRRSDGESSSVGNILLRDKWLFSITAAFWGRAADKWMPVLEVGKVYTFRNGKVKDANKRFDHSPHQYQLHFNEDAEIVEEEDEQDEEDDWPIKELTPRVFEWTVRAQVVWNGGLNSFQFKKWGSSVMGNILLTDKWGDSINAVFWGDAAREWIPLLERGKVYTFSNGTVKDDDKRFSLSPHPYELCFKDPEIEEVEDEDPIPMDRRIKELTTGASGWTIRARVDEISERTKFTRKDGESSSVGNILLTDKWGDSISAVFWGDAADHWFPRLQEGKVYSFKYGKVKDANKQFSISPHPCDLHFNWDAEIEEVDDEGSSITKLRDIDTSTRTLPYQVDLCVVVSRLAPSVDTYTREIPPESEVRRYARVRDDTGFELSLTLWGDMANNKELLDCYERRSEDKPVVVILQNVQIREYNGKRGSTLSYSHIIVNPDDPEAASLREWYCERGGKNAEFQSLSEGGSQSQSGGASGAQSSVSRKRGRQTD